MDRVAQTFTRMVMGGVPNLCVMSGDAARVLPERIPSASLSHVFINHPQPPQQRGSDPATVHSQASHLITKEFFQKIFRVLVGGGQLTIVTDNLWYVSALMSPVLLMRVSY